MRHRNKKAKLNRTSSHRKAMVANMVCSLLEHESINTTETKAREVCRTAETMITFAKKGDLHARRRVLRLIPNKRVVGKLFSELGPRFSTRNGGYTRMVKSEPRRGDGANMCLLELVGRPGGAGEERAQAGGKSDDRAVGLEEEEPADEAVTDTPDEEAGARRGD